jgi:hypothetical protein
LNVVPIDAVDGENRGLRDNIGFRGPAEKPAPASPVEPLGQLIQLPVEIT